MKARTTNLVAVERLRELLTYDEESGFFIWNVRLGKAQKGQVAGCVNGKGYTVIRIDGSIYLAHRLAWLYKTGVWPTGDIDHIDGARSNNRWANLRDVCRSENIQNQRVASSRNKTSGLLGVGFTAKSRKNPWVATIELNGKAIHIGCFPTPQSAHEAYLVKKREIHAGCTI